MVYPLNLGCGLHSSICKFGPKRYLQTTFRLFSCWATAGNLWPSSRWKQNCGNPGYGWVWAWCFCSLSSIVIYIYIYNKVSSDSWSILHFSQNCLLWFLCAKYVSGNAFAWATLFANKFYPSIQACVSVRAWLYVGFTGFSVALVAKLSGLVATNLAPDATNITCHSYMEIE